MTGSAVGDATSSDSSDEDSSNHTSASTAASETKHETKKEEADESTKAVPSTPKQQQIKKKPDTPHPSKSQPALSESKVEASASDKKEDNLAPRMWKNGLVTHDLVIGKGAQVKPGHEIKVQYIGRLVTNGKVFDQSRGKPFGFKLGAGQVIKGWDIGVQGMKVGGKRKITIPPSLGYGTDGSPPQIPPNAALEFEIEIVGMN